MTEESTAEPPTADLSPGRHYLMTATPETGGYAVRDDQDGLALVVPPNGGGDVIARNGRWWIGVERKRHGWEIAAHAARNDSPVAEAKPRLRPRAYDVTLTLESPYRLAEEWLSTSWNLRAGRSKLARVTVNGDAHRIRHGGPQASINVLDDATSVGNLGLLMAITLVTIGVEALIPGASAGFTETISPP